MKVVAMIPARYEAHRFPGKLLKDLAGKPVIIRTYENTLNSGLFDQIYVVTDSDLIANEIEKHKGLVIKSIKSHETGSDRIAEAAEQINADIVINVQGDEPFVNTTILYNIISEFKQDIENNIDVVSLVFPLTDRAQIDNPNNVKVVMDESSYALYFSRAPIPYPRDGKYAEYFQHIGIYGFRKSALIKFSQLPMSHLEKTEKLENLRFLAHNMTVKMIKTNHKSIGIDTPEDLEQARKLFKEQNV